MRESKLKPKYKIFKDEHHERYFIKKKNKFLFWVFYTDITQFEDITMYFETLKSAENYINDLEKPRSLLVKDIHL